MNGKLILAILFVVLASGCRSASNDSNDGNTESLVLKAEALELSITAAERAFLENLRSLCGKSFRGEEAFMAPGRESWAEKKFMMHVTVCEDDRVYIPFHLDEDRSRTWMFLAEEGGLRFRHDHRHEDGNPEELTMYGGYADGKGNRYRQHFPADNYTVNLLDDGIEREWRVILDEDLNTFSYQLLYSSELIFEARFDLTSPVR